MQLSTALDTIVDSSRFFSSPAGDPVAVLQRAHQAQSTLCDMLELIADSIPARIDPQICSNLADDLTPLIRNIHHFEEDVLFPLAIQKFGATAEINTTITRLKYEHCEDECFAEELSDALRELGADKRLRNPEALGYMLRGFFEAMRRHIAFEREHLTGLLATGNSEKT
ncbi:MAG: hemerythrin domain-containing protein [Rhizobiaceae bacterium]|nr:hemerythrin domain-containing protein [Rhizobiaceae bacterium]